MIRWEEIGRAEIPGGEGEVILRKHGEEFSIRTATTELMNSRLHGSEETLAKLTCRRILRKTGQRILIGGLGMGYTLAAALKHMGEDSRVTVVELIPAMVSWNREYFAHLAGKPLDDGRVSILEEDVGQIIGREKAAWDAILLDVDNGPDGLTRKANERIYGMNGLKKAFWALRTGGILSIWSSGPDEQFTRRLKQCQFETEVITVRAHKSGKGSKHTIWLATKP